MFYFIFFLLSGALGRILFVKGAIQVLWYYYCIKNRSGVSELGGFNKSTSKTVLDLLNPV